MIVECDLHVLTIREISLFRPTNDRRAGPLWPSYFTKPKDPVSVERSLPYVKLRCLPKAMPNITHLPLLIPIYLITQSSTISPSISVACLAKKQSTRLANMQTPRCEDENFSPPSPSFNPFDSQISNIKERQEPDIPFVQKAFISKHRKREYPALEDTLDTPQMQDPKPKTAGQRHDRSPVPNGHRKEIGNRNVRLRS